MLRENRLISLISILGTALSIAMIMVVCLVFQIQSASFSPETNRNRMLYIEDGTQVECSANRRYNGFMSQEAVRECFYTLKKPEAVSAWFSFPAPLSLPGKRMYNSYDIMYSDPAFWKIYDFRFLEGKPFTDSLCVGIHTKYALLRYARHLSSPLYLVAFRGHLRRSLSADGGYDQPRHLVPDAQGGTDETGGGVAL